MGGTLYGIGVGPGDPELLTLKAIDTIKKCDVIAIPNAGNDEKTAFNIVKQYTEGKPLLECLFSMERNEEKRKAHRLKTADYICEVLDEGKDVGFITLGDPTIYSTYMYVHAIVKARGYFTKIIPGIPSFAAAAAALDISLCEGNEALHIIPGSQNDDIEELFALKGNKVLMKSGKSLNEVLDILSAKGMSHNTKIVERCTMDGEQVFNSIDELKDARGAEGAGYFSLAIIK